MPPRPLLAGALLLCVLLAGCTDTFRAARVPDALVQGDGGNGWVLDTQRSDPAPRQESAGLVVRQSLTYLDDGDGGNGGYPASLSLTTLRLVPTPSEDQLRTLVRDQVRARAEQNGIRIAQEEQQGSRTIGSGHGTLHFLFTGNVTGEGPLFTTRDASARILGEVWNCPEGGTSVVAVGMAQVSRVQRFGGVPINVQHDTTNWRELVADPQGTIGGFRGADGLVYNVVCAA